MTDDLGELDFGTVPTITDAEEAEDDPSAGGAEPEEDAGTESEDATEAVEEVADA